MENIRKNAFILFVMFVLVQSTTPIISEPLIVNYDDNPNLKKAMEYDLSMDKTIFENSDDSINMELYNSYVEKADRELAEKYYLTYLEDINESFQRARVYAKLGDLYVGRVSNKVTKHEDVNVPKALQYYEKALAEAPEAISLTMINVRGGLTMLPDMEKGFLAKLDYYEWMLSINEQEIIDNWLPLKPENIKPNKYIVDDIKEVVSVHSDTTAYNIVDRAVTLGIIAIQREYRYDEGLEYDPKYLLQITERFPGTKAEELAKKEISKLPDKAATKYLEELDKPFSNNEVAMELEESEDIDETPVSLNHSQEVIQTPLASAREDDIVKHNYLYLYIIIGGILILSFITFLTVKKLK